MSTLLSKMYVDIQDVCGTPKMYVGHPRCTWDTQDVRGTFKVILRHFKKYISLKDERGTLGKTPPHLYAPTVRKSTLEDQLISKVNYTCIKKTLPFTYCSQSSRPCTKVKHCLELGVSDNTCSVWDVLKSGL